MIQVIKSERKYCVSCCERDPEKAFEIRFGNPEVSNISVMTVCGVCLSEIQKQSGEVNPIE